MAAPPQKRLKQSSMEYSPLGSHETSVYAGNNSSYDNIGSWYFPSRGNGPDPVLDPQSLSSSGMNFCYFAAGIGWDLGNWSQTTFQPSSYQQPFNSWVVPTLTGPAPSSSHVPPDPYPPPVPEFFGNIPDGLPAFNPDVSSPYSALSFPATGGPCSHQTEEYGAASAPTAVTLDTKMSEAGNGNDLQAQCPAASASASASASSGHANPFRDNAAERIPFLGEPRKLVNGAEINGYIKFRGFGIAAFGSQSEERKPGTSPRSQSGFSPGSTGRGRRKPRPYSKTMVEETTTGYRIIYSAVLPLSSKFCSVMELGRPDGNVFQFYLAAWCTGRTLLLHSNCWADSIAQMAVGHMLVRHSLLALSSLYVIDYLPAEDMRIRSNRHYARAVDLLDQALMKRNHHDMEDPVQIEGTVAAIAILCTIDVVCPELRRPKHQVPRWLEGARVACKILNSTDEGQRYWDAPQVQPSAAKVGNSILIGRAAILSLLMMPLDLANTKDEQFQWLLSHPSEEETRKIHGACGCSPRLLHRFAQITHLAALMQADPQSTIIPHLGGEGVAREIHNLRQWSELGQHAYPTTEALLAACDEKLDENGLVSDKESMTDITGEAWRLAAILYLECRLYRLPRSHHKVLRKMKLLAKCISKMPTNGQLFTAQAPFFPVFLLGLLSVQDEHYKTAKAWFDSVTSANCRSSVPPAYDALKRVRKWALENLRDDLAYLPEDVGQRPDWWERVVAHAYKTEGTLCLI